MSSSRQKARRERCIDSDLLVELYKTRIEELTQARIGLEKVVREQNKIITDHVDARAQLGRALNDVRRENEHLKILLTDEQRAFNIVGDALVAEIKGDVKAKKGEYSILQTSVSGVKVDQSQSDRDWSLQEWLLARPPRLVGLLRRCIEETTTHQPSLPTEQSMRYMRMLGVSLASIYSGSNANTYWEFGRRLSFWMKARTGSRIVVDTLAKIFPGCISNTRIDGILNDWIEQEKRRGANLRISPQTIVVAAFDNVGLGSYKGAHTARLGAENHAVPVCTNRCVIEYTTPDDHPEMEFIQKSVIHGPQHWLTLASTPADILQVKTTCWPKEMLSEAQAFESFKLKVMELSTIREFMHRRLRRNVDGGLEIVFDAPSDAANAATVKFEPSRISKICGCCHEVFDSKRRLCDVCDDPDDATKRRKLVKFEDEQKGSTCLPTPTVFQERKVPQPVDRVATPQSITITSGPSGRFLEKSNVLTLGESRRVGQKLGGGIFHGHSRVHLLPVRTMDPGKRQNKPALVGELLKDLKVHGHSGNAVRKWIFMACDLGAASSESSRPVEVFPILALGHESMCHTKTVAPVVCILLGQEAVKNVPQFRGPYSWTSIADVWDQHKSAQFIKIARDAIVEALMTECALEKQSESFTGTEFLNWCQAYPNDGKFTFFVRTFVLDLCPAYFGFRTGCREHDVTLINASRKSMLPFLAARRRNHYAPAVVNDIIRLDHQSSPIAREMALAVRLQNGQGVDFKLEELNKQLKALVTTDTERGWLVGSLLSRIPELNVDNMWGEVGIQSVTYDAESRSRREPDTSSIVRTMVSAIMKDRLLKPVRAGQTRKASTLYGTPLLISFSDLTSAGSTLINAYFQKVTQCESATLREPIPFEAKFCALTSAENPKEKTGTPAVPVDLNTCDDDPLTVIDDFTTATVSVECLREFFDNEDSAAAEIV